MTASMPYYLVPDTALIWQSCGLILVPSLVVIGAIALFDAFRAMIRS